MKQFIVLLCFIGISISGWAQFDKGTLQAAGLTCALCSRSISKSLEKLSFVLSVAPDIKNSSFQLVFRNGQQPDPDAIRKAVEDAGFTVAKLELSGKFNSASIKSDSHLAYDGLVLHFLKVQAGTLNGEVKITLVDKNFIAAKAFKSYAASSRLHCVHTEKAEDCCRKMGIPANTRIYHVTI